MEKPVDIEAALADALIDEGWHACAPPLPSDFGKLPLVTITRTGGGRRSRVVDTHRVSIDVRAGSWNSAIDAAERLCGVITQFELTYLGGAYCHSVEITTLPYQNVDPSHRDVPRMTFAAELVTGVVFN